MDVVTFFKNADGFVIAIPLARYAQAIKDADLSDCEFVPVNKMSRPFRSSDIEKMLDWHERRKELLFYYWRMGADEWEIMPV